MLSVKLRVAVVLLFFLTPVAFLSGVGAYHLWKTDWAFIAWWPMALCFLLAYTLAWYWTRKRKAPTVLDAPLGKTPDYWTTRDKSAWKEVEAFAGAAPPISQDEMGDLTRYAADAQTLATKITHIYHPNAKDPFGHLTLPELMACAELIAHDLAKLVDQYVPGGHVLTVNNFRAVRTAADWYQRGRNVYWIASMFVDPLRAGMQILATKAGLQSTFKQAQANIIAWFYTAYLHELGRYLIELNSGRLRVGAKRYLELIEAQKAPPTADTPAPAEPGAKADPSRTTIAFVGPTKAGKSSLVNAVLGADRAGVSVLPLTAASTRYDLNSPNLPGLSIMDTVGFAHQGATDADILAAVEAASVADILVLVVPARSAARSPEVDFLRRVQVHFAKLPQLKMPPVVMALSHIDLLSPAMEWQPPYDVLNGTRPKELSIREAMAAAREVFGENVNEIVPVCTAPGKEMGVRDSFLGVLAGKLGEARGVGLLRTLHAESTADKTRKMIAQTLNVGREILKAFWGKPPG